MRLPNDLKVRSLDRRPLVVMIFLRGHCHAFYMSLCPASVITSVLYQIHGQQMIFSKRSNNCGMMFSLKPTTPYHFQKMPSTLWYVLCARKGTLLLFLYAGSTTYHRMACWHCCRCNESCYGILGITTPLRADCPPGCLRCTRFGA
jgi:hypothetical protein